MKCLFTGLLFFPLAMYSFADDQHYSCDASKNYESAGSVDVLLSPGLGEDGALPVSMVCGNDSMKDVVDREKLKAYINGWKESFGEYTKNTCNRTYLGECLSTDKEREEYPRCVLSRWEVYDKGTKKYIASAAYDPSICYLSYLSIDEEYRKKGIGSELGKRVLEDMRTNHDCRRITLISVNNSGRFWEKLGGKSSVGSSYVFSGSSLNVS